MYVVPNRNFVSGGQLPAGYANEIVEVSKVNAVNFPVVFGVISALVLWGSARAGAAMHKRSGPTPDDKREDLSIVVGAILTLLGLLIGFSFSMAISRYDQRKNYEEEEANAIGTEYVRADFLPAANAAAVRQLLTKYLDQRILSYTTRDHSQLATIDAETVRAAKRDVVRGEDCCSRAADTSLRDSCHGDERRVE